MSGPRIGSLSPSAAIPCENVSEAARWWNTERPLTPQSDLGGRGLGVSLPNEQTAPRSKKGDRHRKLTDEQLDQAVRMYRDLELSVGQVAEHFGVTRQAMWDRLRKRTEMRPQLRHGQDNHFYRGGARSNGRAHDLTEKAIERGELVRPDDCETCGIRPGLAADGRSLIQAHHCDYNRPLDVMWLCQPCHHEWHRNNVAIEVAS